MSFTGFLISCAVLLLITFAICITVTIIAVKIKIKRRKQKNQYYEDIHKIAEHIEKK